MYGFCLMPDHVHLVVESSASCDILTFVARFKNLIQRAAWRRGLRGRIWQARFWDRFLRAEEQLETVVSNVLNNPVRKGLASDWKQYPFGGAPVLDL